MLKRLGSAAHTRRRVVVAVWLAVIIALAAAMSTVGNQFSTQFNLPDVESAQGFDLLAERFGGEGSGRSGTLVVQAESGFSDTQRTTLNEFFARLDARDDMRVVSPFSPEGARQVSPTGTIAFATVTFPADIDSVEQFAAIYEAVSYTHLRAHET